ncbi:hypothetical protein ALP98_200041 [Pseudomonas viridiflava]|uniref:Uncharacterized protein n=2 Tax=Pseudomonas syringae group TaxID=136849 RepID=A0A3M4NXJ1_PSEVI|nr:hypothetical protein ALQ30_200731 [Pseudomonas syringae pv. persicae]RMQ11077.1 hypothetical protein ALQ09_200091 [Pseudomonas viridiflava]RMQ70675.1 hypothetical protein ALP98_200041 [Pseudomonas viridiflava]
MALVALEVKMAEFYKHLLPINGLSIVDMDDAFALC